MLLKVGWVLNPDQSPTYYTVLYKNIYSLFIRLLAPTIIRRLTSNSVLLYIDDKKHKPMITKPSNTSKYAAQVTKVVQDICRPPKQDSSICEA